MPQVPHSQLPALEPLVADALDLLAAPVASEGQPETVDDLADRLLYAELVASSSPEVAAWGRPVFRAAALAALRVHVVALSGDELQAADT